MNNVTLIIQAVAKGEASATDDLLPVIYSDLKRLASSRLANERAGHTLQPTALVHEAYMRLVGSNQILGKTEHTFTALRRRQCGGS